MRRLLSVCFALFFLLSITTFGAEKDRSVSAENSLTYDVVIYGGTSAAVIAAEQVKKMGASVVVVSPDERLGGLSSGGLGATDSGNRTVIGGLSRDFYHRLWQYYQNESAWTFQKMPSENGIPGQGGRGIDNDTQTMWVFEPHAARETFEQIIAQYDIPVFRGEWLNRENGVKKNGAAIESISTLSGKSFFGRRFIDATYEGDLMAAAGVSYMVGRESNAQYGETLNGVQTANAIYHQFEGFVDPYVERGNPASGILPMVNSEPLGPDGSPDGKVQAYNLRMCLTNCHDNRVAFDKPDDYDPTRYELLFRSVEAGQTVFTNFSPMPNFKTDSNNNFAVSTDYIGQNYDYPEASYARRREIYAEHLSWHKGLFWTLAHHERVPEEIRKTFNEWGLAKDEFTDNGNWSPQMYIREARRMVGDFVVTERHLRRLAETPRPVGMGSYNMDSHHIQRYVAIDEQGRKTVRNEGDVQVGPGGPYQIDFGALLPKKSQCDNLLVPVCVSCSHIAYGSIRMEPVFMILGQSAATAAVLSLDGDLAVQDVDYAVLERRLVADGQVLESTLSVPAILPQSLSGQVLDETHAAIEGTWTGSSNCEKFVGRVYIHDGDLDKGKKSASFTFNVSSEGEYEVRVSYCAHANRATNVPVSVTTDRSKIVKRINQKIPPAIDGLFVSVGNVQVGPEKKIVVSVRNDKTDGHVVVDSVQVLPR